MIKRFCGYLIFIIYLVFSNALLGHSEQTLDVMLGEAEPMAGETFQLIFRIKLEQNETPDISFDSGGLEILGKSNQGMSLKTVYMNGSLTTSREITYVYDLLANRASTYQITGIKAETSQGTLRHKDIVVRVVNEVKEKSPFFLRAEVSKTNAYVGESIIVTYYLYQNADNLISTEIKKFPNLNNFTKRFYDRQSQSETVNFNGTIYRRTNFYTAVLFPEKSGKLKIDPISIAVTYVTGQQLDPFGGFGLSFGGGKRLTRTMSSEPVEIMVESLPAQQVPKHFTGLVGTHQFKISTNKTKTLVNDPIEVKLEVSGPGALEKLNPVEVFQDANLEEFDSQFDLEISELGKGLKTFRLTYLARADLKIPPRKLPLAYFDPAKKEYVTVELDVPGLEVSGGGITAKTGGNMTPDIEESESPHSAKGLEGIDKMLGNVFQNQGSQNVIPKNLNLIAPDFTVTHFKNNFAQILFFTLLLVILCMFFLWGKVLAKGSMAPNSEIENLISKINKTGINYGDVYRLVSLSIKAQTNQALYDQVQGSKLSDAAKTYFCQLLKESEIREYKNKQTSDVLPVKKKFFKEIRNYAETHGNLH